MATSRQERMQERLRGANAHQVQDAAFDFVFSNPAAPAPAPAPEPSPALPRTTPNTSAKRKRLDDDVPPSRRSIPPPPSPQQQQQQRQSGAAPPGSRRRPSKPDVYAMTDASSADEHQPSRKSARKSTPPATGGPNAAVPATTPRLSAVVAAEEVVAESPADAPGSGQRLRIEQPSSVISTSVLLQEGLLAMESMIYEDEDEDEGGLLQASSPLTRKQGRKSAVSPAKAKAAARASVRRSARVSDERAEEGDELSPDRPGEAPPAARRLRRSLVQEEVPAEPEGQGEEDELSGNFYEETGEPAEPAGEPEEPGGEEAQEIGDAEAARRLGRRRSRRHAAEPSPELDSSNVQEEEPAPAPARRRRATAKKSPAKQKQPRAPTTERKRRSKTATGDGGRGSGGTIEVTVQRFPKPRHADAEDLEADDVLDDMPFVARAGVNAVDVFLELSRAVVDSVLEKTKERAASEQDAGARQELRVRKKALEAFGEELGTRLLEQTIALDNLHTLKQRVRRAQREKLALRNEILRVRAEREQVALRMDATRIKHEEDSKRAHRHVDLSSAMHDIDLAVEQGRAAPELSAAEQKRADLANLELLIGRVSEHACSTADGGGTLNQVRSFNAFLERVAAAI